MQTKIAYRNNCIRPRKFDLGKTIYFERAKPKGKLMLNDIRNAAICDEITTSCAKITGCRSKIKL